MEKSASVSWQIFRVLRQFTNMLTNFAGMWDGCIDSIWVLQHQSELESMDIKPMLTAHYGTRP